MKIKIHTFTMLDRHTYIIDQDKNLFEVNGIKLNDADINDAIFVVRELTSEWPETLEDNSILDGLRCKIIIEDRGNKKIYTFTNKFPVDFYMLINYLQEVRQNNDKSKC